MTTQKDNQTYADLDRQTDGETMNLPASDRGRPCDDAESQELPGQSQQTPPDTENPPGGKPIKF